MFKLIKIEWLKTFRKWRTYIGFCAIAILLPLTYIGLMFDQGNFLKNSPAFEILEDNFFILGNILNGFFVSRLMMFFLMVHIPFLIVLVAGDQVAGEAASGTLRMILIRPPSRLKIITAKAIISIGYTTMLVLFMAFLSLGLGFIMFGSGDLLVLDKGFIILTKLQAVRSFLLAYVLAMIAMYVIAGLSFLLSVLADNSIGPIIGTMAIVIVSVIISETPIALFEKIRPFLFTTYTNVWKKAFFIPLPANEIIQSILFLFCFIIIFFGLAFYIFNKKDILT